MGKLEKGYCGCFDTKQGRKVEICFPKNAKRPKIQKGKCDYTKPKKIARAQKRFRGLTPGVAPVNPPIAP